MQVVVMGVSGSGKSTVGEPLAAALGLEFVDGDDLHPPENVAKMAAGVPLDDADRRPWLDEIGAWLADRGGVGGAAGAGGVVACSALKRSYRDRIRDGAGGGVRFVHLAGAQATVAARQEARTGHFMPASLLASQYADLEPLAADELDRGSVVVDVAAPVPDVVAAALAALRRPVAPQES